MQRSNWSQMLPVAIPSRSKLRLHQDYPNQTIQMPVASRNLMIAPQVIIRNLQNKASSSRPASKAISRRVVEARVAQKVPTPRVATSKVVIQLPSKATHKVNNPTISRIIKEEVDKKPEDKSPKMMTAIHLTPVKNPAPAESKITATRTRATRSPAEPVIQKIRVIKPTSPRVPRMEPIRRREPRIKVLTAKRTAVPTVSSQKTKVASQIMLTISSPEISRLHSKLATMDKAMNRALNMTGKHSNASGTS